MSHPMLAIGMHVEIKRSDGRIHGAVISEIKAGDRYMVEWYEKGDTKGKEATLQELLQFNPMLSRNIPQKEQKLSANRTIFGDTREREKLREEIAMKMSEPCEDDTLLLDIVMKNARQPSSNGLRDTSSIVAPRRTQVHQIQQRAPSPPVVPPQSVVVPQTRNPPVQKPVAQIQKPVAQVQKPAPQIQKPVPQIQKPVNPPTLQVQSTSYPQQAVSQSNANFAFAEMIREYRAQIDYRPLSFFDQVNDNRISVCVRQRPLNKKELTRDEVVVVTVPSKEIVVLHQPQSRVDLTKYLENQKFRFDYAFDESASNELVYRFTAQPLVKTIFDQGTATCFAYGQTGSGKTHTMGGDFTGKKQDASMGIYALTARDVFKMLEDPAYRRKQLHVACSFYEIYGNKVYDLLNEKKVLRILEDGKARVNIVGLKEEPTKNESAVLELINRGTLVRTAGTTSANANSSRSHAVFQIMLRHGKDQQWGKFSLIDLAGNERGQDTRDCDKETRLEGAEINKSLLALKECIRAMGRNSTHVPFRQSKLTLVLRDSFIGEKARTVMISMIAPGLQSCEHTLNTLRYANRVKEMGTEDGESTPVRDEELFAPPEEVVSDEDDDMEIVQTRRQIMDSCEQAENGIREMHNAFKRDDRKTALVMMAHVRRLMDQIESVAYQ